MSKWNMIDSHIEVPSTDVIDMGMDQYSRFFKLVQIMLVIALIALAMEMAFYKLTARDQWTRIAQRRKRMLHTYNFNK